MLINFLLSLSLTIFLAAKAAAATPLQTRLADLAPLFSPAPGSVVEADQFEVKSLSPDADPTLLRGVIVVSPRPDQCLTITVHQDRPDKIVCSKKALSFRLKEMNAYGQIEWLVRSQDHPNPVPVRWQTPYRVAYLRTLDDDQASEPPKATLLKSCAARPSNREVTLEFFNGEIWVINLPEQEVLVPQPPPLPNLYVAEQISEDIIGAAQKKADAGAKPTTAVRSDVSVMGKRLAVRENWHIPAEETYELSAARVAPHGFSTPGIDGECRYRYRGPEQDPTTGRLECHGLPGYDFALVPLPCIQHVARTP